MKTFERIEDSSLGLILQAHICSTCKKWSPYQDEMVKHEEGHKCKHGDISFSVRHTMHDVLIRLICKKCGLELPETFLKSILRSKDILKSMFDEVNL